MPDLTKVVGLPIRSSTLVETVGANTAASIGTPITSPVSIDTWSNWTELLAATAQRGVAIIVGVQYGAAVIARIQIGKGAIASETPIAEIPFQVFTAAGELTHYGTFIADIPSGSRISARCMSHTASITMYVIAHIMEVN